MKPNEEFRSEYRNRTDARQVMNLSGNQHPTRITKVKLFYLIPNIIQNSSSLVLMADISRRRGFLHSIGQYHQYR